MPSGCPCTRITFQAAKPILAWNPAPAVNCLAQVWAAVADNQLHKLRIDIMKAVYHRITDRKAFSLHVSQMLQVFQFRRNDETVATAQNVALIDLGAFELCVVASEVGGEK
jgi:hypothetical protein